MPIASTLSRSLWGLTLAATAGAQAQWMEVAPYEFNPGTWTHHAVALQPATGEVVVAVGEHTALSSPADEASWSGAAWAVQTLATSLRNRTDPGMAAHTNTGQLVLFGGRAPEGARLPLGETWVRLASGNWALRQPASGEPSARYGHAMAAAPNGDVILFGGQTSGAVMADTWRWDGSSWSQLAPPSAPPARVGHAMAFDAARGVVVLFGGRDAGGGELADTWEWNGNVWSQRAPATIPSARVDHALAYDALRGELVLFGGFDGAVALGDTWTWDGATWTQHATAVAPPPSFGHGMAAGITPGTVLLFGGRDDRVRFGDLWSWNGATWNVLRPARPEPRRGAELVFDSVRGELLLYGGVKSARPLRPELADLWRWDGSSWCEFPRQTSWPPAQLFTWSAAFDEARGRMVLVNGNSGVPVETIEWDGTAWGPSVVSQELSPGFVLVYHGRLASVLSIHSGGEVRAWDGSSWALIPSTGRGPGLLTNAAYDAMRDRVVANSGSTDTLEWDGATWVTVPRGGPRPRIRTESAYHAGLERVVACSGDGYDDQETLEFDGTRWEVTVPTSYVTSPTAPTGFAVAYDSSSRSVYQFGGDDLPFAGSVHGTLWRYGTVSGGSYTAFGAGCPSPAAGLPVITAEGVPCVGGSFALRIQNVPFRSQAFVLLGASRTTWGPVPLPLALGGFGAPGCELLVSPDAAIIAPAYAYSLVLPLRDPALLGATFYNQAVVEAIFAHPLGLVFSAGYEAVVGGF